MNTERRELAKAVAYDRAVRFASWLVAIVVGCVGCDPADSIGIVVTDSHGAPLANARIAVVCPNVVRGPKTETGADGVFRDSRIPAYDAQCVVTIEHEGFEGRVLNIHDAGFHHGGSDQPLTKIALDPIFGPPK